MMSAGKPIVGSEPIGFGIIGCGVISRWHAAALKEIPDARLVSVADSRAEACTLFARENQIEAAESVEAMLADPRVQVVIICTPSGLHAPQAIQAANAGRHVVIEKPMALNVADADRIIEAAKRNNVLVEVVSQLRTSPGVQLARRVIEESWLGRLTSADIYMKYHRSPEYYASGGWRGTWEMDGGGALMNQGIHGVDLLLYICGAVERVFARARTLTRKIEVEDTLAAVADFAGGAIGVIQATTSVWPGRPRRLELSGDKGMIVLEEDQIAFWEVEGRPLPEGFSLDGAAMSSANVATAFSHEGHRRQLQNFVTALRGQKPKLDRVDAYEGRRAVALICAIYESARTNRFVDVS